MIRICSVLIAIWVCIPSAHAQTDSLRDIYIKQFPDKFFIWPLLKKREISFSLNSRDDKGKKLTYKPNTSFSAGIGFYIFEIATEVTFAVPIDEQSNATYGASDARDLQINTLGKSWGIDLYSQKYSGFYAPNPAPSPTSPDRFIKRSDIELKNTGINLRYILNKNKFSLRSAYNYSERQLKSAGSVIISGTVNTFRLQADSSVLNQVYAPGISTTSTFKDFQYTAFSMAPGYAYSLIYKSFFLNGTFSMGPAHYWISYTAPNQATQYNITLNTFADVRIAIGYNSDRFFGGMSLVAQTRDIRFDEIHFANGTTAFKLLVGYRFGEVGILKRSAKDYFSLK
ncbi:MAG: DUF4421 family protein [Cyclobacteriaceae bacterium]|nr:DUF4421 family protein [Cyclobacteriaceae bacterium]